MIYGYVSVLQLLCADCAQLLQVPGQGLHLLSPQISRIFRHAIVSTFACPIC